PQSQVGIGAVGGGSAHGLRHGIHRRPGGHRFIERGAMEHRRAGKDPEVGPSGPGRRADASLRQDSNDVSTPLALGSAATLLVGEEQAEPQPIVEPAASAQAKHVGGGPGVPQSTRDVQMMAYLIVGAHLPADPQHAEDPDVLVPAIWWSAWRRLEHLGARLGRLGLGLEAVDETIDEGLVPAWLADAGIKKAELDPSISSLGFDISAAELRVPLAATDDVHTIFERWVTRHHPGADALGPSPRQVLVVCVGVVLVGVPD